MNTQNQTIRELLNSDRVRNMAHNIVVSSTKKEDYKATVLALLATALEQECIAQGLNPAKLKFFTTEVLE